MNTTHQFTVPEAARLLGVTTHCLLRHVERGSIRSVRLGKWHIIELADLLTFKAAFASGKLDRRRSSATEVAR